MNAIELRIGNWLNYPFIGNSQIRDGADIDNVYSDAGNPIPLTPEILEMAGFVRNIDRESFDLTISNSGMLSIDMADYSFAIFHNHHEMGFAGNVLNLHQLQNHYFALTATELEINLNKEK